MRRALLLPLAVLLALAVILAARPAAGHSCTEPVEVPVGEPNVVAIGVTGEGAPITEVSVRVPAGFEVAAVPPVEGWQSERTGRDVRWTGGTVEAGGCTHFLLEGTPTERGKLVLPLTTVTADGTLRVLDAGTAGREDSAMLVYAGVSAAEAEGAAEDEEAGEDSVGNATIAVLVAIGAVVLAGAIWAVRRFATAGPADED